MRFWLVALIACGGPRREPALVVPVPIDAAVAVADSIEPDVAVVAESPCEPFDIKNPACLHDPRMCLHGHADCVCPSPPDANNPACWAVMPCPNPPDQRIRACFPKFPACKDPDPDNPNCPPLHEYGRVIAIDATAGVVTIGVGSKVGITTRWTATLLRGDSDEALPDGAIELLRVDLRLSVGRFRVPEAVVRANSRVRFSRPK